MAGNSNSPFTMRVVAVVVCVHASLDILDNNNNIASSSITPIVTIADSIDSTGTSSSIQKRRTPIRT